MRNPRARNVCARLSEGSCQSKAERLKLRRQIPYCYVFINRICASEQARRVGRQAPARQREFGIRNLRRPPCAPDRGRSVFAKKAV